MSKRQQTFSLIAAVLLSVTGAGGPLPALADHAGRGAPDITRVGHKQATQAHRRTHGHQHSEFRHRSHRLHERYYRAYCRNLYRPYWRRHGALGLGSLHDDDHGSRDFLVRNRHDD